MLHALTASAKSSTSILLSELFSTPLTLSSEITTSLVTTTVADQHSALRSEGNKLYLYSDDYVGSIPIQCTQNKCPIESEQITGSGEREHKLISLEMISPMTASIWTLTLKSVVHLLIKYGCVRYYSQYTS